MNKKLKNELSDIINDLSFLNSQNYNLTSLTCLINNNVFEFESKGGISFEYNAMQYKDISDLAYDYSLILGQKLDTICNRLDKLYTELRKEMNE